MRKCPPSILKILLENIQKKLQNDCVSPWPNKVYVLFCHHYPVGIAKAKCFLNSADFCATEVSIILKVFNNVKNTNVW